MESLGPGTFFVRSEAASSCFSFQLALHGPQQLRLHGLPHQDGRAGRVDHSQLLLAQRQELIWAAMHGGRDDGERARECDGEKLPAGELQLRELGGKGEYTAGSTTAATAGDSAIKLFIRFLDRRRPSIQDRVLGF